VLVDAVLVDAVLVDAALVDAVLVDAALVDAVLCRRCAGRLPHEHSEHPLAVAYQRSVCKA